VGAVSCRDDRGWKPLPQERYFITAMMASRATTGFQKSCFPNPPNPLTMAIALDDFLNPEPWTLNLET
jgi:hypothetical protein